MTTRNTRASGTSSESPTPPTRASGRPRRSPTRSTSMTTAFTSTTTSASSASICGRSRATPSLTTSSSRMTRLGRAYSSVFTVRQIKFSSQNPFPGQSGFAVPLVWHQSQKVAFGGLSLCDDNSQGFHSGWVIVIPSFWGNDMSVYMVVSNDTHHVSSIPGPRLFKKNSSCQRHEGFVFCCFLEDSGSQSRSRSMSTWDSPTPKLSMSESSHIRHRARGFRLSAEDYMIFMVLHALPQATEGRWTCWMPSFCIYQDVKACWVPLTRGGGLKLR